MTSSMPRIIYGTAWKKAATKDLVGKAVMAGFSAVDTACQPKHYNEPAVGLALDELQSRHGVARSSLFIQTKCVAPVDTISFCNTFTCTPRSRVRSQDPANVPYDASQPLRVQVAQSVSASLRNLKSAYIDCLLLHSPLSNHKDLMEVWRAMEAEVERGSVRSLGISNCYTLSAMEKLWAEAAVKPRVLQNRRVRSPHSRGCPHLLIAVFRFYQDTSYDVALRSWCTSHDVTYQSFWTLTANPHVIKHQAAVPPPPPPCCRTFIMVNCSITLANCSMQARDVAVRRRSRLCFMRLHL
jgi:hypothetical protein